jgi:hypothetical protein
MRHAGDYFYFKRQARSHPKATVEKAGWRLSLVELNCTVVLPPGFIFDPPSGFEKPTPADWAADAKSLGMQPDWAADAKSLGMQPDWAADAKSLGMQPDWAADAKSLGMQASKPAAPSTPADWAADAKAIGLQPSKVVRHPGAIEPEQAILPCGTEIYREPFAEGSDELPGFHQIAALLAPILFGFLIPWGSVRITAWVAHGFLADRAVR